MPSDFSSAMELDSRIFVAGHKGLAGSAIVRKLKSLGYRNLLLRSHAELDLTDQAAVRAFMQRERPRHVFVAAARVGGIHANNAYPAEFLVQNLGIELNVIDAAYRCGVERLLFMGASCLYPKFAAQPMKEEYLLTGLPEPTNEAYALAKIAGIKMCAYYNRQYGTNYLCVLPANLYGLNDNFHPTDSHVIPALVRRLHEAKAAGAPEVVIWGSGNPRREFMSSDDLADACVYLMRHKSAADVGEFVNVGSGKDVSIRELAQAIQRVVGYAGRLVFDTSKPDGSPQKLLDISRLTALGWSARDDLETGLRSTYQDFLANHVQSALQH